MEQEKKEDIEISYTEWGIEYYKTKICNTEVSTSFMIKIALDVVTGRLVARLNCVTGKYYGSNHMNEYYPKYQSEDEAKTLDNSRKERLDGIRKAYEEYEEAIKILQEKCGKNTNENVGRKELDKIEKKRTKQEELLKDYRNLMREYIDAPLGKQQRFSILKKDEVEFFDYLLDEIDERILKRLNKGKWEELSIECREKILEYLGKVADLPHWELTDKDLEDIEFKLCWPALYRYIAILKELNSRGREMGDEDKIEKEFKKIDNSLDKLYKLVFSKNISDDKKERATEQEKMQEWVDIFEEGIYVEGGYMQERESDGYFVEKEKIVELAKELYATKRKSK